MFYCSKVIFGVVKHEVNKARGFFIALKILRRTFSLRGLRKELLMNLKNFSCVKANFLRKKFFG